MKTTKSLLIAALMLGTTTLPARENDQHKRSRTGQVRVKAAGCSPSVRSNELDLNNVRARIETGGNMWQNREGSGGPAYEVPKTPERNGPDALFAGALWMGGEDPAGNLKLAAVRFRQDGNDYWPGPLDTTQATITAAECERYDRTWKTMRNDVEQHVAYYTCLSDPDCDPSVDFPDGWVIPTDFQSWPAIGDVAQAQALYLAPFGDLNDDGDYDPSAGDYPGYDLDGVQDCKNRFRGEKVTLYGDQNIWWVFNDKGNTHTESQGAPIGMEIHGQAFAFSTNDEVNNMTFYNYELINRGSLTLENTYFGQWVDPDLGFGGDDFVGCDVQRGLGYAYNGTNDDIGGSYPTYGVQPPAVGVDFFEGPYQDADQVDNPLTDDCALARAQRGIVYAGIGIGYGDTTADNERFGMRAFLYHNNAPFGTAATQDPDVASEYYNFLLGVWKDNTPMTYGGTGYSPTGGDLVESHYMFPGNSDPLNWGTECIATPGGWSEVNTLGSPAINPYGDRRFIQSAGPFTLEPGAYNNITVGVVWARANAGGPLASLELVRTADDKAQALFDNCFRILNGPDAPNVSFQELDKELLLYITNPAGSNNFNEAYVETDPTIPDETIETVETTVYQNIYFYEGGVIVDSLDKVLPLDSGTWVTETTTTTTPNDKQYRFQGYKIYQVKEETIGPDQLNDNSVARLVAQVDLQDGVGRIVNYTFDPELGLPVPVEMVNGGDNGVEHAFRITEDLFAAGGSTALVNFKTYHFMAIAYGYNNYRPYDVGAGTGQAFPYKPSRKAAAGSIRTYSAIPHKPGPEAYGTVQNAQFGDRFPITRLEGQGNGGLVLQFERATEDAIMEGEPWRKDELHYKRGFGPVDISVVDPLKVPAGQFEFWMKDTTALPNPTQIAGYLELRDARWMLVRLSDNPTSKDTVRATAALQLGQEQLILDWGLSVKVDQARYTPDSLSNTSGAAQFTELLGSSIEPLNSWYAGIADEDGETQFNWIRSGTAYSSTGNTLLFPDDSPNQDVDQVYEGVLGGTWAPWALVGRAALQPSTNISQSGAQLGQEASRSKLSFLPSVTVVFTPDKTKWTRCPVLETQGTPALTTPSGVNKLFYRPVPSVDKNGLPLGNPDCNVEEASQTSTTGMGWFPGYAVCLETGERLNMAFGEDSFLGGTRGRDMIWNPNDEAVTSTGEPFMGGGHWIYVFGNRRLWSSATMMPQYDAGVFAMASLNGNINTRRDLWMGCSWVGSGLLSSGSALLSPADGLIPGEVRITLNVSKPYNTYVNPYEGYTPDISPQRNGGLPLYTFNTGDSRTQTNVASVAESSLDLIGVVPNPYYAFSGYQTDRLDNRVKFINLPPRCTISIYSVNGTLVRKYRKDNELTYLDWDLKNGANVPIAGGTYICHIDVPDVGERVLKWFGVMRPVDLQNF
ncbi:MAG TPA: T9SS C-terminal target domain-containing protein [Flavobacteriales bacterium]